MRHSICSLTTVHSYNHLHHILEVNCHLHTKSAQEVNMCGFQKLLLMCEIPQQLQDFMLWSLSGLNLRMNLLLSKP